MSIINYKEHAKWRAEADRKTSVPQNAKIPREIRGGTSEMYARQRLLSKLIDGRA
jgi:hypothetical protein